TSVDRITPRLESTDIPAVRAVGWIDAAPVVTEPFHDWVLSGVFPAGRPDWASAGARFVDDIEPWEFRKLWLLNGAHSILAYAGALRGHATVAEAIADPVCRSLVERFHDEAVAVLPAGVEHVEYRTQLIARFSNAAIVHRLEQIAADGADKVRYRIAAVAERTVAAGGSFEATAAALATWVAWVLDGGAAPEARATDVRLAAAASDPVEALVVVVSPTLAAHPDFLAAVREHVAAFRSDHVPVAP
ncbi:MAG TPA: mannitol dehydrogenase family protein, partial [Agromyces sp.]|nr:mannitol dehydrogenase family protein [Agromyces sp.]